MQKISAVLIMKNEEALLSRCLDSLNGVDEIILCDTGSTDKTVEIGKKYTDKIVHFEWCDNFSKARNYAKSFATGDWIISIDCDEILHDFQSLREAIELAELQGALAVNVKMISEDSLKQIFDFPRVFKNDSRVWWEGAIHNHISVVGLDIGNVWITYGYSPAHNLDKDRAFRILKKEVAEKGNPREMFYLGREYFYRNMFEDCIRILNQYVNRTRYLPEKAEAYLVLAKSYWELRMSEESRNALINAIVLNANFKEAILLMAKLAGDGSGNEKWQKNADQWKRLAQTADNFDVLFVRT